MMEFDKFEYVKGVHLFYEIVKRSGETKKIVIVFATIFGMIYSMIPIGIMVYNRNKIKV